LFSDQAAVLTTNSKSTGNVNDIQNTSTVSSSNLKLVFKFTSRYHAEAHEIIAGHGYAPKFYGYYSVCGGLYKVVMEYINGDAISVAYKMPERPPQHVYKDVRFAVELLHKSDSLWRLTACEHHDY
jgi:hypothetical protein